MMDVRAYLKQGKPLLFDGAMGTLFAAAPGHADLCCEQASLLEPKAVAAIHRAYLDAGAKAIKANTFGVSSLPASEQPQLIAAACRIAQEAAAHYDAFVFADIGPAPQSRDMAACYIAQADCFLAQGVTNFLMETLPTDEGVAQLAQHLRAVCPDAYLIVSFAVNPDGVTPDGLLGTELFRRMQGVADAVGFNCLSGPGHLLQYIRRLPQHSAALSVMPNAGYPTVLGRRTVFKGTPDYFSTQMAQIAQCGAAIIGGCCGTTPEHIRMTADALAQLEQFPAESSAAVQGETRKAHPNALSDMLEGGRKVIAVELDPPVDDDIAFFMDGVRTLRDLGANAVTIADCPIGRPRADSSLLACKIKRELGMEPLPHLTCRDRNMNATKALLLGLSIEGVHNVLLVTGDPIPTADRDEVKSVFNFNSRKLSQYVRGLNEEVLATPFRIFGALNVNAPNFQVQLRLAQEKEACGMTGFLTQPVLSREAFENLQLARKTLHGKILGGIFPVVSHRNACFLNNEISGMRVCDEIVSLYEGKTREEAEELAVTISTSVAKAIEPFVDGFYLMTPFKRVQLIGRILEKIRA
ncbi:MAG: bifunctional homocysteine S-methyltransferase/methylenetetrahydrofolate reductase [Clostridia bacterium]|nr:bifunctional homocysteine S-methyltransferase/methylenetetrahydrofolate reductase [Clostridia bacterium]